MAETAGDFPRVVYGAKETGGMGRARAICSDRFGWIYVGNQRGLIRFDGQRWEHVYVGKSVSMLAYDGKDTLYGLTSGGIGCWKIGATDEYKLISLEQPILEQGLLSAGAFRDIAKVGDYVYATKTTATARMAMLPDGQVEVVVIKASQALPNEYKFRSVRLVDGRPLVGAERRNDPRDYRFGWLDENGKVEVQPSPKDRLSGKSMRLGVIDFVDASDQLASGVIALAVDGSNRRLTRIVDGEFELIGPWADDPPTFCERPSRIFPIDGGQFMLTSQGSGAAVIDAEGEVLSRITSQSVPGSGDRFHQDLLGRFWFPSSVGVVALKTRPRLSVWEFPGGAIVNDFAFFKGSIVAITTHGVFTAKLAGDARILAAPFVRVSETVKEARSVRVVGDRLFICNKYGLHVAESLEDLAQPKLIPATRTAYVLGVTAGALPDDIVVCCASGGMQRLRLVDGQWEVVQHEPKPTRVGRPFQDAQGNVWALAFNHLDEGMALRIEFDQTGAMHLQRYDINGVPVLMAGEVYLFTLKKQIGLKPSELNWGVKRYESSNDSFADDHDLAQQLKDNLPQGFYPAAYVGDVTSANTGDLLISGGTSSFFKLNRSLEGKLTSECLVELEMPGLVTRSLVDPSGNVWLAAQNQLYCRLGNIDNAKIEKPEDAVLFTKIALLGSEDDQQNSAKTVLASSPDSWHDYRQRELSLDFSNRTLAIGYAAPFSQHASNVLFQTKMIGISDRWSTPTRKSEREYAVLKEGRYKFLVRAILPSGIITEPSVCNIEILPPWYRTNLAKFALLCFGLVLTGAFVQWRVRWHKKQVAVLKKEVADRVEAEKQLRVTQQAMMGQERLRAMGELAAGVAHDVNNALAPVAAFSELIVRSDDASENIRTMAGHVHKSSKDAAAIIRRIQPLYWGEDRRVEEVSIDSLVKESVSSQLELIRGNGHAKTSIEIRCDARPAAMWCSSTEIREVIANLLNNAVSAVERDGTIDVSCQSDDEKITITVKDDGIGMDSNTLENCFSAFYSTKGRYGSGLGLSTSRAIVNSYGGSIAGASEEGRGTTFTISLPIDQRADKTTGIPIEPTTNAAPAPKRILLVEDIDTTRSAIAALVESLGHTAIQTENPLAALDALRRDDGIQIVLTDYGMPEQSGTWLCEQVSQDYPNIKLILMTGHELPGMRELSDDFLLKPVSIDSLREAISKVSMHGASPKY